MSKIGLFSIAVLIAIRISSVVAATNGADTAALNRVSLASAASKTLNNASDKASKKASNHHVSNKTSNHSNSQGGFVKTSLGTSRRSIQAAKIFADRILVEKNKHRLTLFSDGEILKRYKISLGRDPQGAKIRSGDNRTPEGLYYIDYRIRNSDFHLALHISYPNARDLNRAEQQGYSPGGDIMLHGLKNGDDNIAYYHGYFDWTNGCIAVTDKEIEEIWRLVPNGTPIEIRP
jgi:murein L,D-transpeptidase YafK